MGVYGFSFFSELGVRNRETFRKQKTQMLESNGIARSEIACKMFPGADVNWGLKA